MTSKDNSLLELDGHRKPAIKAGWLRGVLFLVAIFTAIVAGEILVEIVYNVKNHADMMALADSSSGIPAQLIKFLPMLLTVWLFCRFIDRRSLSALGFKFDLRARRDLISGLLWGVGLMSAVFLLLLVYGEIEIVEVSFNPASLMNIAVVMALVAVGEEMVFRGYLLASLMESMNKYVALIAIASLFSLSHIMGPNPSVFGLINIILGGLLLGIYYIHRRNLWFPIGLHFTWNFFQGPVFGSSISGWSLDSMIQIKRVGSELLTGGDFGFEASLITTVAMIIAIVAIHRIYRIRGTAESPT